MLKLTSAHADTINMSDLSDVLGELYGNADADGAPVRKEPSASARIAEAAATRLSERSAAEEVRETTTAESSANGGSEDHLAMALSAALATLPAEIDSTTTSIAVAAAEEWAESLEEKERGYAAPRKWQRTDDDILPPNWKKSRFSRG